MSLYNDLTTRAKDKLPESGSVGTLANNRPGLYYLVIITTLAAYIGIITFTILALGTLAIAAGRALTTIGLTGDWLATIQWYSLAIVALATGAVPVYLSARWAAQYTTNTE